VAAPMPSRPTRYVADAPMNEPARTGGKLAARLRAEAKDGQIRVSSRIAEAAEPVVSLNTSETWN
jgi:hypothetical protein